MLFEIKANKELSEELKLLLRKYNFDNLNLDESNYEKNKEINESNNNELTMT